MAIVLKIKVPKTISYDGMKERFLDSLNGSDLLKSGTVIVSDEEKARNTMALVIGDNFSDSAKNLYATLDVDMTERTDLWDLLPEKLVRALKLRESLVEITKYYDSIRENYPKIDTALNWIISDELDRASDSNTEADEYKQTVYTTFASHEMIKFASDLRAMSDLMYKFIDEVYGSRECTEECFGRYEIDL